MTPNAGYVKPTIKQSLTLFLSILSFLEKNANDNITGWERLRIRAFVEMKNLMFPTRNDTSRK